MSESLISNCVNYYMKSLVLASNPKSIVLENIKGTPTCKLPWASCLGCCIQLCISFFEK